MLLGLLVSSAVAANSIVVGSTFDYPPLTYIQNNQYLGDDVKIIQEFAADNKLDVKFVKTTWPTLSQDLQNNKFDIAVGGISENAIRKKLFLLSVPYGHSSKVPLIRCSDSTKFTSLSTIDLPQTRVVENKGGTNESFAKIIIKNAPITVVNDSQQPFLDLLNNKADVMFTDDIEASYRHQLMPKLCVAKLDERFPVTNKVFLFGKTIRGKELQRQFNSWWKSKHKFEVGIL